MQTLRTRYTDADGNRRLATLAYDAVLDLAYIVDGPHLGCGVVRVFGLWTLA